MGLTYQISTTAFETQSVFYDDPPTICFISYLIIGLNGNEYCGPNGAIVETFNDDQKVTFVSGSAKKTAKRFPPVEITITGMLFQVLIGHNNRL